MTAIMRARIRAGEETAFGELFDEHAQAVYRHAVWTDGDHGNAEDVVSLTFLEAWRIRETLRPDGESLRPWLLGIATNVLRNRRRTARRYRAALSRAASSRVPAAGALPDFADEVVGRMYDAEQLAAAATALRALRRADREVFLLCVWQQLDYAAVAEALGIPVGTVRSRLSRARTRLRARAEAELTQPRRPPPEPDPAQQRHPLTENDPAVQRHPLTENHPEVQRHPVAGTDVAEPRHGPAEGGLERRRAASARTPWLSALPEETR
ncbi:RNA polymerase sigma factor [Actinoplanes sp. GCM10030250]|uniref:RNA polymerase sigma factor n=1 Tax=Actinoplanes sp. GCM10030250 TaxID=3273376 RepID=UPI00360C5C72